MRAAGVISGDDDDDDEAIRNKENGGKRAEMGFMGRDNTSWFVQGLW